MSKLKHVAAFVGLTFGIVAANAFMPAATAPQPASAAVDSVKYDGDCTGQETAGRCADKPLLFDHSNCQYPDRTTNPANGCDNSDPCDPANVKGGSGDCTAPAPTPAPVAEPKPTNQCGGK